MTPAERLRAAAEKIRETAKGAEWTYSELHPLAGQRVPWEAEDWGADPADQEHIALWSPPVALAVADLLDAQARYVDDVAMMFGEADHETDAMALALADLILGAES